MVREVDGGLIGPNPVAAVTDSRAQRRAEFWEPRFDQPVGLVTALIPYAVCGTRSNQQALGLLCFAFQFLNLLRRHAHRVGKLRPGYGLRLAVQNHALTPNHPIAFFDQGGIDGASGGCVGR
jgi:hypothetical protein